MLYITLYLVQGYMMINDICLMASPFGGEGERGEESISN